MLRNNHLCLQNKLKKMNRTTNFPLRSAPHPTLPLPLQFHVGLLVELWPLFFYRHILQVSHPVGPRSSVQLQGCQRWEVTAARFTATPGSAVWLPPGACWSWWRRKGQRERCWSACSRSRPWARRTASRGRPGSGRCPDHKPQPAQENMLLAMCRFRLKNTK